MEDLLGRKYARLSQIKSGDFVLTDNLFSTCGIGECLCLVQRDWRQTFALWWKKWVRREDTRWDSPLYIECHGSEEDADTCQHFLDSCISDVENSEDYLIGLYIPTLDELLMVLPHNEAASSLHDQDEATRREDDDDIQAYRA